MDIRINNEASPALPKTAAASFAERVAMGGPGITVVISCEDYRILFVNTLFTQQTGYSAASSIGMCFPDLLEPYERDRIYRQFAALADDLRPQQDFVVYRLRTSDGSMQPFYLYVSRADIAGDGSFGGYHLFLVPDGPGWNMPYTSSDTKELFLKHFESEGYGTFEWIMDVDKVFWSAGIYRIYEVDPGVREISLQFVRRFVHPGDRERVMGASRTAIEGSGEVEIEFRIITARNNIRTIHSLGRILRDSAGRPVKFIGSVHDVTTRRAIEDNLKKKNEELSRSNRELEEFAYAASHDLQEPLRKITTFSDRLLEKYRTQLAGEGEMYLSRMNVSAENMRLLINGLLDFSRISQTQAPFAQVSLSIAIKQVMTDLELKIEETGTTINFGVLPVVDAVATLIKQLFTNLISNAIKFHKAGEPPVINIASQPLLEGELQQHGLPARKNYHKITVTDNGIGFEAQYANRIFQVFQRLHGKSEYPGSGVGLAICKKILEHHKGVIYAESAKGEGARFTIIMPDRQ